MTKIRAVMWLDLQLEYLTTRTSFDDLPWIDRSAAMLSIHLPSCMTFECFFFKVDHRSVMSIAVNASTHDFDQFRQQVWSLVDDN